MPNTEDDFDERGVLRDGRTLRVPVMLADSHYDPKPDGKNYGLFPPGPGVHAGAACMIDGRAGTLHEVRGGFLCVPIEKEDAMREIHDKIKHKVIYDPEGRIASTSHEIEEDAAAPTVVLDAFGSTAGLSRPGLRYTRSGAKTTQHAEQVARDLPAFNPKPYADVPRITKELRLPAFKYPGDERYVWPRGYRL